MIHVQDQVIECSIGKIHFDYLVLATGTDTNFYNISTVSQNALPMKTVSEALKLRNVVLENFEYALTDQWNNYFDPDDLEYIRTLWGKNIE